MDTTEELAELKKEVATLKGQMADLKRFLNLTRQPGEPGQPDKLRLHVSCTGFSIKDSADPFGTNSTLGGWMVEPGGSALYFRGDDSKSRVILEVKNNKPAFRLFNDDLKQAVVATLDDTDHAYVAVFDHGKPRAAMKATEPGGIITVAHDDGFARASLSAQAEHGSVRVVNSDMKTVGELTSKSALGSGGALFINTIDGKRSTVITSTPYSGFIALHDAEGKLISTLPASPEGEDGEDEEDGEKR